MEAARTSQEGAVNRQDNCQHSDAMTAEEMTVSDGNSNVDDVVKQCGDRNDVMVPTAHYGTAEVGGPMETSLTGQEANRFLDEDMGGIFRKGSRNQVKESLEVETQTEFRCALVDDVLSPSLDGLMESHMKNSAATRTKRKKIPLVLETYDGSTELAGFLSKFQACQEFNEWDDVESFDNLKVSLRGEAEDITWIHGKEINGSWQRLVQRLQARFGHDFQALWFQDQLVKCRQEHGETLRSLGHRIMRLAHWAYPEGGDIYEEILRATFLKALTSSELRCRLAEKECRTLDEMVKKGSYLEILIDCLGPMDSDGKEIGKNVSTSVESRGMDLIIC